PGGSGGHPQSGDRTVRVAIRQAAAEETLVALGVMSAAVPLDEVAEAQDEDEIAEDQRRLEHRAGDVPCPCFHEIAAHPEVDDQRGEHEKMSAEAHSFSVQESITSDDAPNADVDIASALDALTLAEVEEAAGELH